MQCAGKVYIQYCKLQSHCSHTFSENVDQLGLAFLIVAGGPLEMGPRFTEPPAAVTACMQKPFCGLGQNTPMDSLSHH